MKYLKYLIAIIFFWSLVYGGLLYYVATDYNRHECGLCIGDPQLPQCKLSACSLDEYNP